MTFNPSRIDVLKVYTKRALRWRANSWPYLSGDAFADLADINFNPPKFRGRNPSIKDIARARVIFVNSSDLVGFLSNFGSRIEAKVVIAGNSDAEFHETLELPKAVKCLLLQNSFISDNVRTFSLPIGIENYRWGVNGDPRNITYSKPEESSPTTLFGPFGNTHPARKVVQENFDFQSDEWRFIQGYISPYDFNRLTSQHRFIACVRGNGIDTHRLWETLYRGRIPIVQEDDWSNSLDYLKLPIRKISQWDSRKLKEVTHKSPEIFDPNNFAQLWMPYWKSLIQSKIL